MLGEHAWQGGFTEYLSNFEQCDSPAYLKINTIKKLLLYFFSNTIFFSDTAIASSLFSSKYLSKQHNVSYDFYIITLQNSSQLLVRMSLKPLETIYSSSIKFASTFHIRLLIFTYIFQTDVL